MYENFATKRDLERFATKEDYSRTLEVLDRIVGAIEEARVERAIFLAKMDRTNDKLENH